MPFVSSNSWNFSLMYQFADTPPASAIVFKFSITAVFIPLKLKSKFSKCVFGSCIFGFPSFANLSIFGPPRIT